MAEVGPLATKVPFGWSQSGREHWGEYLATVSEWDWLAEELKHATKSGIPTASDTETIGCDPEEESPVGNARVVIWSVGIADGELQPRGYRLARGYVLPWQAALHPGLGAWLSGEYGPTWLFNARYDRHAFANLGVETDNIKDCLDYLRILDPGNDSYALKMCMPRYLGYPAPFGKFKNAFTVTDTVTYQKKVRQCSWDPSHDTTKRKKCEVCNSLISSFMVDIEKPRVTVYGLPEVLGLKYDMTLTPGEHFLWQRAVDYSASDAVATAETASLLPTLANCNLPAKIPPL